jgi:acetyl esterase/lipase
VPNPVDVEPWRSLAAENTPGLLPRKMPIFLSQGTDDQLVRPDVTKDYMAKLCRAGSRVSVVMLPGVDHGFIARDSANDAANWMAGRFAGDAAPSDCSRQ